MLNTTFRLMLSLKVDPVLNGSGICFRYHNSNLKFYICTDRFRNKYEITYGIEME